MRILALDHGTKRIGVAVSDETKTIAQPLEYIPAEPFAGFLERLRQLIREKEIDLILIGLPRNMDGSLRPGGGKGADLRRRAGRRHHRADQNVG
jgi:putative Holliday junction resolvase